MEPSPAASAAEAALWRSLMVRALRRGVPREEAEDLAGQAFAKALEGFAPERGSFEAFCGTIHANLLRNWWRDCKPTEPWDDQAHERPAPDDQHAAVVDEEERAMYRDIAARILAVLDPDEAALFLALGDICREAERAGVSAAAHRLGLEPLAAWDIFRRIQRKARPFVAEFDVASEPPGVLRAPAADVCERSVRREILPGTPDHGPAMIPIDPWHLLSPLFRVAACADAGFANFAAGLSAEQRDRLAACLA
jgi:hypothetical protein